MKSHQEIALIALTFILSRAVYYWMGVRFDATSLPYFYQYLDVEWLKNDLLRSLWNLHSQPPLFNLYLGIGLKLLPTSAESFWWVASLLMGIATPLMMYRTMVFLGASGRIATGLAILFLVSPHTVLFENWLFYSYPTAFLLVAATYGLTRFLKDFRWTPGFVFFLTCAALVMTRSVFHLVWLLAVSLALLKSFEWERRRILVTLSIPLLVAIGWYGKNALLFGKFSGSTWIGMSLAKTTVFRLPDRDRERLIAEGTLSEISRIRPFGPVGQFAGVIPDHVPRGVPALDRVWKADRKANYNHFSYIEISERFLAESFKTIWHDPIRYCETIVRSFFLYFRPPTETSFLDVNLEKIAGWNAFFTRWMTLQILPFEKATKLDREGGFPISFLVCCYSWMILFPLTVVFGMRRSVALGKGSPAEKKKRAVLLFLLFNILFLSLILNMLEYGENNRFCFVVQPLVLILFGLFLTDWTASHKFGHRKGDMSAPHPPEVAE